MNFFPARLQFRLFVFLFKKIGQDGFYKRKEKKKVKKKIIIRKVGLFWNLESPKK